jgi:hypothetical protein
MGAAEDLFAGIRPSDLRFDNVHILAEYIARAHRFTDSATRIEKSAEQLVQGAMRTTQEGVKQFQAAVKRMQSEFKGLDDLLRRAVDAAGLEIANAVAEAHTSGARSILQASEVTSRHHAELASRAAEVNQAAARLEQAAALAEANRQRSHEELEKLQAFRRELVQFEGESRASIADARAKLYRGVGLWRRVVYVFAAPVPEVRNPKAPSRLLAQGRDAKHASPPSKGQVGSDGKTQSSAVARRLVK